MHAFLCLSLYTVTPRKALLERTRQTESLVEFRANAALTDRARRDGDCSTVVLVACGSDSSIDVDRKLVPEGARKSMRRQAFDVQGEQMLIRFPPPETHQLIHSHAVSEHPVQLILSCVRSSTPTGSDGNRFMNYYREVLQACTWCCRKAWNLTDRTRWTAVEPKEAIDGDETPPGTIISQDEAWWCGLDIV